MAMAFLLVVCGILLYTLKPISCFKCISLLYIFIAFVLDFLVQLICFFKFYLTLPQKNYKGFNLWENFTEFLVTKK